ncbi:hypothetical protein ALC57_07683 [Trachymyrmex cornetzi]|uniref:Transposable element Tc3 transposase n=1 Tax=Trachymyrmex cornetzi TaxID=471704 RepID=A0A195E4Y2_9HYME|nr:hypothetical protein ALC57_07683 [Trachymyrmex cornetzi]
MMRRCDENESFPFWICFSDEATFQLSGEVNRHNMRYWSDENPHWMKDIHTQHPLKINVWAGILCNQIVVQESVIKVNNFQEDKSELLNDSDLSIEIALIAQAIFHLNLFIDAHTKTKWKFRSNY